MAKTWYNRRMEITFYKSYYDATQALMGELDKRKVTLREKHIVLVPDIYTLEWEKMIFLKNKGSFDIEVMTFSRLYQKLCSSTLPVLDKTGAVLLVKKIMTSLYDELVILKSKLNKIGYASTIYDIITKLYASDITPQSLMDIPNKKIQEIGRIYQEFDSLTHNAYIHSAGKMKALSEMKNNEFFSNAHMYICNYDIITPLQERILSSFDSQCLSMHIFASKEAKEGKIDGTINALKCDNDIQEYKFIAKDIYNKVVSGAKFNDCIVVGTAPSYDKITRIFGEMDIPFYMSNDYSLSNWSVVKLIDICFDLCSNLSAFNMKMFIKNVFVGFDKQEIDDFCNYIDTYFISYDRFLYPFTIDDDKFDLKNIEKIRSKCMDILLPFIQDMAKCENVNMFISSIKGLLNRVDYLSVNKELASISGIDYTVFVDKLDKLFVILSTFCDDKCTKDDMISLFREGVKDIKIPLIPPKMDCVTIGPPQLFRGIGKKYVYVLDFNEGVLPLVNNDIGLILDNDIDNLAKRNISYSPKVSELNARCRDEIWQIFHSCSELNICYLGGENNKESFDFIKLQNYNKVNFYPNDSEHVFYNNLSNDKKIEYLTNKSQSIEFFLTDQENKDCSIIYHLLHNELEPFLWDNVGEYVFCEPKLFFPHNTTSISALQTYYRCPYQYFLKYGLSIKEKPKAKVMPVDIGNIMHELAYEYTKAFSEPKQLLDKILSQDKYYKVDNRLKEKLYEQGEYICKLIKYQLDSGLFDIFAREKTFSPNNTLKSIKLEGVDIVGKIDRIDSFNDYARVIDYKTGSTTFKYDDLYMGIAIQLPIYLAIMRENEKKLAGCFYLPLKYRKGCSFSDNKMDGLCLFDKEIYSAMDKSLQNDFDQKQSSDIMNFSVSKLKSGKVSTRSTKLVEEDFLNKIVDYACLIAKKGIKNIMDGHMQASPYDKTCSYCEFKSICKEYDKGVTPRKKKGAQKKNFQDMNLCDDETMEDTND